MATPTPTIAAHPSAVEITAADLQARFLPAYGMLGVSLRHRGAEILRRVEDLDTAAAKARTGAASGFAPTRNGPNTCAPEPTMTLLPIVGWRF